MKTSTTFSLPLQCICNQGNDYLNQTLKTKKMYLGSLFVMLFMVFTVSANTYFDPKKNDHLKITIPTTTTTGNDKFSYVDFRVLAYDFNGEEDRMQNCVISINEGYNTFTEILNYYVGDNEKYYSFTPVNNNIAGYIYQNGNAKSDDLRYTSFRWYYPQRLAGTTVTFRVNYWWRLNWYHPGNIVDYKNNHDLLKIDLPSYSPKALENPVLKVIDGTSEGKWFNFSWSSFDASYNVSKDSTQLELYSDSLYMNKIYTSSIINGSAGNINLALGKLNTPNYVWPKLVYTNLATDPKSKVYIKKYEYSYAKISLAGFTYPIMDNITFDACSKTISLNWHNIVPTLLDSKSKSYIYRKRSDENIYTLLTPSGLVQNIVNYNDNDAGLVWDKEYSYIIRTCPDFLTANAVSFTNGTAKDYMSELLVERSITTKRQVLDFSKFTATPHIAVVGVNDANVELKWEAKWCNNNPQYVTLVRVNTLAPSEVISQQVLANSLRYVDKSVLNSVPYKYCLIADNSGKNDSSSWVTANVIDQCKFLRLTTTKGVLNDRVRLSWEIDKPKLNNKFIISRKIYDNGSKNFDYEQIAEKQSVNSIENWEDLSISPGILYKYKVESYYQPSEGSSILTPTVDSIGNGLGFSQPIGTISGAVSFGSGTAVEGVNVLVVNTNPDQKLYKGLEFSQTGAAGTVAYKSTKHGCIATGFTWQAMLKPANRSLVNASIYEMQSEYSFQLNGNMINVFVNDNSLTSPVLSKNISSVASNKYFQLTISYNKTTQYMKLYVDGVCNDSTKITGTYVCKNKKEAKLAGSYLAGVTNYKGLIDEMRLWNRALTSAEIKINFDRYLSGSETDLIGYWQMDEGINGFAFDKSNISKTYNENHINLYGVATSDSVPSLAQLSIKALTDKNGNYIIQGVPYKGNGSTYDVVPLFGTHEFEPSRQQIFIGGTSSEVQSKINFKDISSFKISGVIYYENSNYPVPDVEFSIDGNTCMRDNKKIVSGADGKYTIDVPIGSHKISVFKSGHKFTDTHVSSDLKMDQTFNFKENRSNIDFTDLTKVTLVGRVVGGDVQGKQPIGFNRSKANIGQATVKIQPTVAGGSQLNYNKGDSLIFVNTNKNINSVSRVFNGTNIVIITTDKTTGEFSVQVPPIPMRIIDVNTSALTKNAFKLDDQPNIETNPNIIYIDTIHSGTRLVNDKYVTIIDTTVYNQRLNLVYKVSTPEFTIQDINYTWGNAFGDAIYNYKDLNNSLNDSEISLVTQDPDTKLPSYEYTYPVFTQGNFYTFEIKGYEKYINPDPVPMEEDLVPLSGGIFEIENNLSTNTVKMDYALNADGTYLYQFMAGTPMLVSPYTLRMTASVNYNGTSYQWKNGLDTGMDGIILGAVPTGGVDFVTKGPDKIIAVLRDPPGSTSFSTLEKGSTITKSYTYNATTAQSQTAMATLHLGSKITLGFGVLTDFESRFDLGLGIDQTKNWSDGTTKKESLILKESISTSSSNDYVGASGDVYIANSSNIAFGKCTALGIVPKVGGGGYELKTGSSYIFAPEDSTAFRYTQYHIVNKLLPNLVSLRKSILGNQTDTTKFIRDAKYSKYLSTLNPDNPDYGKLGTYNWVLPTTPAEFAIDSVQFFTNQITQWENIIRQNEIEKLRAMGTNVLYNSTDTKNTLKYNKTNFSFDAGTVLSQSMTRISNFVETDNVDWQVQFWNKNKTGVKIGGMGVTLESESKAGGGKNTTDETTNESMVTYSYTLADGDTGNYFAVDVYTPDNHTVPAVKGTKYTSDKPEKIVTNLIQEGSPIFSLNGGQSSCPYEKGDVSLFYKDGSNKSGLLSKGGTVQIEDPYIAVTNPTVSGIASGKQATFELDLTNLSETNTACWFKLYVDPKTNPQGAIISIDGTPLTDQRLYLIAPKTTMRKTVRLAQSSTDDLEFKNIRFKLQSICDTTIYDDAFITANFVASCSDLTMQIDDRVINTTIGTSLNVVLKDFDKNYKNFAGIRLYYKGLNELQWMLAKEFVYDKDKMKPTSTDYETIKKDGASYIDYDFEMNNKQDQTYQFKAKSICANDKYNETEIINVIKDTQVPFSMGLPSPSNGILTPETEVSVTFNENIQVGKIVDTDVQVWGVLNGFTQTDNVGLLFDDNQTAYTELPINLQSSSFTIEGKFLANTGNAPGTIFSIGEGENRIALQMNVTNLKVIAGNNFSKETELNSDDAFQYFGLTYDAGNQTLTMMLWSTANPSKSELFSQRLSIGIAPVGRLVIGENFKGSIRQMSIWNEVRTWVAINDSRSKSKTGRELNLVGYWPMDEGYGSLAADKALGRNLIVKSSWFITPKGYAAELNGSNYIAAKSGHFAISKDYDLTLEFWFKGTSGQKNATLYSCSDSVPGKNISVGFNSDGNLTVLSNNNPFIIPSGNVLDSVWHHFGLSVMRGGNAIVYIDGTSRYQTSAANFGEMISDLMVLGARRSFKSGSTIATIDNWFTGSIDEVRVWHSALTTENIRLNLHSKLTGNEIGLLAYYPFEKYNDSGVIKSSLQDCLITSGIQNGGTAIGENVSFTENTPAIKANLPKVKVQTKVLASDNKIVIDILDDPSTIENCYLEFNVQRIMDLNSNSMAGTLNWTAFVNMNRLKWETGTINMTKEMLAPQTFNATISNNSGKYENYVVSGLPSWLSVNKTQGTLNPLNKETLIFTVDNATNVGNYECSIRLTGSKNIDEILPVILKITGSRPDWSVNPYSFESSMNVLGQIMINQVGQEDTEDILAAFNGTQCVGMASPQFDKSRNSYFVYMDIYGNNSDIGKPLTFSLWDAGTGRIYPALDPLDKNSNPLTLNFVSSIIGSINSPQLFNATDKVEQQLSLKQGWNWISTNVVNTNPTLISQFKSGIGSYGIELKSRAGYIGYSNGNWIGDNFDLDQTFMYMLKTNQANNLKLVGAMAKPGDYSVLISPNWNWIGYLPQFVTPVKDALSSLPPKEGDQIKGQIGFASYSNNVWYGSLQYLLPGTGYMYNSKNPIPTSFKYPSQYLGASKVDKMNVNEASMKWSVDVSKYQLSMTVTGVVIINNVEVTNPDLQLAVFVGNECRGTATLKYIEVYQHYEAFLMVWGNIQELNQKITFKSFNPATNQELTMVDPSLGFIPDNIVGSASSPYKINFNVSGLTDLNTNRFNLYPNPVVDVMHFNVNPSEIQQLEIVDNVGRVLVSIVNPTQNNINVGNLLPGAYTLRIRQQGVNSNQLFIKK